MRVPIKTVCMFNIECSFTTTFELKQTLKNINKMLNDQKDNLSFHGIYFQNLDFVSINVIILHRYIVALLHNWKYLF